MKVALVLVWPVHIDYPLFRYKLKKFYTYFSSIFIVLSNLDQKKNYSQLLKEEFPFATLSKPLNVTHDWRDDAVKTALTFTPFPDYYLFMEQDFLTRSYFWENIFSQERDFIYFNSDGRIHPAFALVKRELLDKTTKEFSAIPPKYDHFGKFFEEITSFTKGITLEELGLKSKEHFYHMAGLTQNYACFKNNQSFYKPNEFLTYNYLSLNMEVKKPDDFAKMEHDIHKKYEFEYCQFLENFFPK